jgi:hypothetical protein
MAQAKRLYIRWRYLLTNRSPANALQPERMKGKQMKMIKRILVLAGLAALLAGCATNDNQGAGAMGNDSETGYGSNSSNPNNTPPSGPNGSISRSNPFGVGAGSGLQRAN